MNMLNSLASLNITTFITAITLFVVTIIVYYLNLNKPLKMTLLTKTDQEVTGKFNNINF